jgi:hypothetical protein
MIRHNAFAACSFLALLVGCGSVPREYHYTLNAQPVTSTGAAPQSSFSIAVGPVTVPETVDQPQMVVQVAPNRVAIEEFHRWAGPLRSEVARVIAANLSQMLNASRVWSYSQANLGKADCQVLVDVQRFDSALGDAAVVEALWTIRLPEGVTRTGRSTVREPATGPGFDAIVAAHGRALARLSQEIADSIRASGKLP